MYPFASQILVAEGPVSYWQRQGRTVSTDGTVEMIRQFPDPTDKIRLFQGQWDEKDEQHEAYTPYIDADYLWICDPDELYREDDVRRTLDLLESDRPDVVSFQCYEFVGDLAKCVVSPMARIRILRWSPGARLTTSRPPTVEGLETHLSGKVLARDHGIRLYHYGHVYEAQVSRRREYYEREGGSFNLSWLDDAVRFEGQHPHWIVENWDRLVKWEP